MIFLEASDLVAIAARVLNLDVEDVLDLVEVGVAEAALGEARTPETADPEGHAAALLYALLTRRPFARGNEPVALVATLQFLALNGCGLEAEPPEQVREVISGVESGVIGQTELREWLSPRVKSAGGDRRKGDRMFNRRGRGSRRPKGKGPFERFTDRARLSVTFAQEEARLLRHNYIGTEHLLLGLMRVPEGVAARALEALGASLSAVRSEVEGIIGLGDSSPAGSIPFTPRTKKVLELSLREALQLGHNYVGTEHILLGILREGEGVAAQVLERLGAELSRARQEVIALLARHAERTRNREGLSLGEFEGPSRVAGMGPGSPGRAALLAEVSLVFDENDRLRAEIERLRAALRKHGIEPDDGETRSA